MQDAHLAHLADLHDAGHVVAAGPLLDDELRGLIILTVDGTRAEALLAADPAVLTGRLAVRILPRLVPAGALRFTPTRLPRSVAEVTAS